MTREDLINKIDGYEISEETKIQLMEDITELDAGEDLHADYDEVVAERDEIKSKYDELSTKYDTLTENYKRRFMTSEKEEKEEVEEDEVKDEVIDIKEI